jgi:hypothetical protein
MKKDVEIQTMLPDDVILSKIYLIRGFMFELSKEELANWRYQIGTSNNEKMGIRIAPFAFTEYGLLMLASVLNSERV